MNDSRFTIEQLTVLIEKALEESAYDGQPSGRIRPVPDLRTIRYYTTLGLLDPPTEMRGRKAYYGRRHVLQLVAIKRLQSRGMALVQIQQSLTGADDRVLARWAELPKDSWDRVPDLLPPGPGVRSPDALLAASTPPRERPEGASVRPREPFWAVTSSVCIDDESSPSVRPGPFAAVHLPVADGVDLVLKGIDTGRIDQETLARLRPALENLVRTLRDLELISAASSGRIESEPSAPFHPEQGK